ncbi:hypothetical protein I79_007176 [Cricetulus griseus]|uniref:Uncharacterized protein n=1 Tax=Cricetulus griseus TaxID=10029 RepID=G3H9U5_CRIGR|nr:hypothetical protein I79_007176 [Cricetulus griseus]
MGLLTLYTWWFCPLPVTNLPFVTKNCVKEVNLPQSVWLSSSVFVIFDGELLPSRPPLIERKAVGLSNKSPINHPETPGVQSCCISYDLCKH